MSDDYQSVPLREVGRITGQLIRDDTTKPFPEFAEPYPLVASFPMPPTPQDTQSRLLDEALAAHAADDRQRLVATLEKLSALRENRRTSELLAQSDWGS